MKIEVLKIRNTVYEAIDMFFRKRSFIEISPPIITSFSCESACVGGSDLISVNYYGKTVYLTQSGQLYLEALASKLEKVYCISPAFRAESTLLATHLSEFWMCEAEIFSKDFEELVKIANDLIISIIQLVLEKNNDELKALGVDINYFTYISKHELPRITYSEAIKLLKNNGINIKFGDDITSSNELILSNSLNKSPFILTHFPTELSAFYKKTCPENPKFTLSFDVIAPNGYRELIGGSERENDANKLTDRLQSSGESLEAYSWYLEIIEKKPHKHGGFGLGIERLVTWLCNLDSIQDSIPFPRTENKTCP